MKYNPMSEDDYEAILWLESRSQELPSLNTAWHLLQSYYEECKKELIHLEDTESPFRDFRKKKAVYRSVQETLSNERFAKEVEEVLGTSKEELLEIIKNFRDDPKEEWMIAKAMRLYNMHLKLGHSARITYIAEQALSNIPEGENTEVLRRTVLLSALLHDVGRFYQSVHYNDLSDENMKRQEKQIGGLAVDHAIAGYYYSLASFLELHKLRMDIDEDEVLQFITEAVAAVVVKTHQQNNAMISYFDYSGSSSVINDVNMVGDAYLFINESYDRARLMNLDVEHQMNPKHKEFIDRFVEKIKTILSSRRIDYSVASGFEVNSEQFDREFQDLDGEIHSVLNSMHGSSSEEVSDRIVEIMNRKIKEVSQTELKEEEKEQYREEILEALKGILDYDIASSVDKRLQEGERIPNSVRYLLSSSIYMTMDADKIDILNQRSLGIYNTSYRVHTLETFPTKDSSLRDILNHRFHFDLNTEPIVLNPKVIHVMNNMSEEVKTMISQKLGDINVFDSTKFPENSEILIYQDRVVINGVEYPSSELYHMFQDEWISYTSQNMENVSYDPSVDFRTFKEKHYNILTIGISREDLDDNLKDCSEEEKIRTMKALLISDGMDKRFKLESHNEIKAGWVFDSENSEDMVHGAISGLVWQLNQFILSNMRNRSSFEFVERYQILDQIYEQYQKKDPMVAAILKDYIDYCKQFIRQTLTTIKEDTFTAEDMEEMRKMLYLGSGEAKAATY